MTIPTDSFELAKWICTPPSTDELSLKASCHRVSEHTLVERVEEIMQKNEVAQ